MRLDRPTTLWGTELERFAGRCVGAGPIRNPYLKHSIEETQVVVYKAA